MSNLSMSLDRRFQIKQNGSTVRTEILAGITTFATMSYVLATIPNMLEQAGLVRGAVLTMLIIAVVACSVAMALYTNRPFCLAPGMSSVAILSSIDSIGIHYHRHDHRHSARRHSAADASFQCAQWHQRCHSPH